MSLTKMEGSVDFIQGLDRLPNKTNNLTYKQLQAEFDKGSNKIKTFINGTLIPEVETAIGSGSVEEIQGSRIADGSVSASKLSTTVGNRITYAQIESRTIKGSNLEEGAITNLEIFTDAVRSNHIKNGEVGHYKLSTDAVWSGNIKDKEVTDAKLADNVYEKIVKDYKDMLTNVTVVNPTAPTTEIVPSGGTSSVIISTVNVIKFATKVHATGTNNITYLRTDTEKSSDITSGTIEISVSLSLFLSKFPNGGTHVFTFNQNTTWTCPDLPGQSFTTEQLGTEVGITYSGAIAYVGNTITISATHKWQINGGGTAISLDEYGVTCTVASYPTEGLTGHGTAIALNMNGWSKVADYTGNYGFKGKFKLYSTPTELQNPSSIEVMFSRTDVESGNYSSYCESDIEADTVEGVTSNYEFGYIFAEKIPATALTIPTVVCRKYVSGM